MLSIEDISKALDVPIAGETRWVRERPDGGPAGAFPACIVVKNGLKILICITEDNSVWFSWGWGSGTIEHSVLHTEDGIPTIEDVHHTLAKIGAS